MRLHQLDVSAFGPFGGSIAVDFDQLSAAGLFLLTGATGAGKTSILDAVCFALYGEVPGDRQSAKRLRSDQAPPGAQPQVVLEVTLSGRRFRIVRSPAWERPKKRGSGTTPQQATVRISERRDGAWHLLSSRLDETGHLISHLVGMNLTQFCQVALLPQGRFQAFLRARSGERHRLLQQLFRTARFEEVERWLRDRRLAVQRESDEVHQRVADLVSRISETTDEPLLDIWDLHDLAGPADDGSLTEWADGLRRQTAEAQRHTDALARVAGVAEATARAALGEGRSVAERRSRYAAADAEHTALLADADRHDAARRTLEAARRAAAVVPVHRIALAAAQSHERAALRAREASSRAATALALTSVDRAALDAAVTDAEGAAAEVRAALPREATLCGLEREATEAERQHGQLTGQVTELSAQCEALPARVVRLREEVDLAREAAARVDARASRVADLDVRIEAGALVDLLRAELEAAQIELRSAVETALRRREEWLDVREARLGGMAAEIALALAAGQSCPVCGSDDHPHKASPAPGAPDAAAEKAALKLLDDAKATEHLHEERVRELTTRIAVARGTAGAEPVVQLMALREQARADLGRLRGLAAGEERAAERLREIEAEQTRLGELLVERTRAADQAAVRLRHLHEQADALARELELLVGASGAADLSELLDRHAERAALAREACATGDALAAAETALAEATSALQRTVREAGFATTEEAVAAARPGTEVDDLATQVRDHERRLAAVRAVLEEPGAAELATHDPPDLPALEAAHDDALTALHEARAAADRWAARLTRFADLAAGLDAALEAWRPLRESLDLTTRLSTFVEGRSPDNQLQMRLSAYVLAYRLTQVVAAANQRLATMSDQRYTLEHTGRRGAGETRGGLSLLVRDEWSGQTRDPATLSGGETFVASLALALGLADVISHEVGGADLDTLFVDEGFGALDSDTLDDVMDTLDSLRDGGRVVGVVSHVAEMRDRIPTQLHVAKSRQGSTVSHGQ